LCVTKTDTYGMTDTKSLFLNEDIRCGGFYELCIQASPTVDTISLQAYNDFFWSLDNVSGPYSDKFESLSIDIDNYTQEGILIIGDRPLPFKQFNIREANPIETGFNWFDISFYTSTIEHVFQLEPQHWSGNPNVPPSLQEFLLDTMKRLFKLHPFLLAFIDFEISGQYYLHELKGDLNNWTSTKFFTGRQHADSIKQEYKDLVTFLD